MDSGVYKENYRNLWYAGENRIQDCGSVLRSTELYGTIKDYGSVLRSTELYGTIKDYGSVFRGGELYYTIKNYGGVFRGGELYYTIEVIHNNIYRHPDRGVARDD